MPHSHFEEQSERSEQQDDNNETQAEAPSLTYQLQGKIKGSHNFTETVWSWKGKLKGDDWKGYNRRGSESGLSPAYG